MVFNQDKDKSYSISATVFIYGMIATMLVTLVVAGCLALFSAHMVRRERDASIESIATLRELVQVKQELMQCKLESATYQGRVHSFEAALFNSNRTAVEASLREFEKHTGGGENITIKEFERWVKQK